MTKTPVPFVCFIALVGCHQPTAEERAAAAFTVSDLQASDGNDLTGCITNVARAGRTDGSRVFTEDSLQGGANGYIRISGHLTKVTMVHGGADPAHSVRSFNDAAKQLSVVESYDIKEAAPGQQVRALSGELIVTYKGGTQRIAIAGARNCIDAP
ncbi:hypothetical protein [Asticcacaulis sp. 201]|uniref:hypothetical protein n=1 Tax=Asticcacaulis sp. 201 TaxID=3028787 RepID=UPI0029165759|nr:hypothetical protein [Asticcacaulis sp. 201]MDV6330535.1 hypothetical protein [Asticcacaulis sp. 201]